MNSLQSRSSDPLPTRAHHVQFPILRKATMSRNITHLLIGTVMAIASLPASLRAGAVPKRNERGLSQSTENAILLAGAVAVAGIVIAAITTYVQGKMPQ